LTTATTDDRQALVDLDARIRAILPEEYRESYQDVQPVSMGSAGLRYNSDGRVAWDLIWGSFCDLAMAGGPPHKGTLLEPGSAAEIAAQRARYDEVTGEICRGITMTTNLIAEPSPDAGWLRVSCSSVAQAQWLLRAIVMENVSARCHDAKLDLPSAPSFSLHKQIKNVVTVMAKTCHYWVDHMSRRQQQEVGELLSGMSKDAPLITPASLAQPPAVHERMAHGIQARTGLRVAPEKYVGWLGVECPDVRAAVWMMRALVVNNILSRREDTTLYVPVNDDDDPAGHAVINTVCRVHELARAAEVMQSGPS